MDRLLLSLWGFLAVLFFATSIILGIKGDKVLCIMYMLSSGFFVGLLIYFYEEKN